MRPASVVGDILLTRQEPEGMMAGMVNADGPATGSIALRRWLAEDADSLGMTYASELARQFDR